MRPYYHSEIWNRTDGPEQDHVVSIDTTDHLGANGWQLHFGKVINPDGTGSGTILNDNPVVVLPDGRYLRPPLYPREL